MPYRYPHATPAPATTIDDARAVYQLAATALENASRALNDHPSPEAARAVVAHIDTWETAAVALVEAQGIPVAWTERGAEIAADTYELRSIAYRQALEAIADERSAALAITTELDPLRYGAAVGRFHRARADRHRHARITAALDNA